ncbi:MAG: tetratricopeptide repeat protein [Nitrospirae bacterium]|nr:MAG: tetratricopeptide repeat protein [Nitrospirota bacterium]
MAQKNSIKIISKRPPEFNSELVVDKVNYHVQTEDLGLRTCRIATRVYLKGEVVFSRDSDYSHLTKLKSFRERLVQLMENQHKNTADFFIREQTGKQKQKSDYFEEVQRLLKKGNGKSAIDLLEEALQKFPLDPFLLSYFGCLTAIVRNRPKEGIDICIDALRKLDQTMPFGSEFFYPVFYLNLGRAYIKSGNKQEAINALHQGLINDPDNKDILWELKKLGTRKKPPLPFLDRSNPINKYIGLLISKK